MTESRKSSGSCQNNCSLQCASINISEILWGGKTMFLSCSIVWLSGCSRYTDESMFCLVLFSMSAVTMKYLRKLLYLEKLHYRHLRLPNASGHRLLKNLHTFRGVFCNSCFPCHFSLVLYHQTFRNNINFQMSCSSVVLLLTLVIFHSLALKMESDEWLQCFVYNVSFWSFL